MKLIEIGFLFLVSGCALSPGQMNPMFIDNISQSCVGIVVVGSPLAGQSTASAEIPVSAIPGLGLKSLTADDGTGIKPAGTSVVFRCER